MFGEFRGVARKSVAVVEYRYHPAEGVGVFVISCQDSLYLSHNYFGVPAVFLVSEATTKINRSGHENSQY